MMKLYQRYLASSFVPPFFISSIFFVCFLLTFQLFRITKLVIQKEVEVSSILELIAHIGISFLPMAIPLSVLFATLFTLGKLSQDSEIVALRSFGLSKHRLFIPFLSMGAIIAIALFFLGNRVIPSSKGQFKNAILQLTSKGMMTQIKKGQFFTDIPGVILYAQEVDKKGEKLNQVFIHLAGEKKEDNEKIIFAHQGRLIKRKVAGQKAPTVRMFLKNGNITKFRKTINGKLSVEKILFSEYEFPIVASDFSSGFISKDSMKSTEALKKALDLEEKIVDEYRKKNHPEYKGRLRGYMKGRLEYWSRYNTPILCLVYVLIGFTLGVKKGRGRTSYSGLRLILVLMSYYTIFFMGVSLARKGILDASLVVFVPTLLLFLLGLRFYKKMDWLS